MQTAVGAVEEWCVDPEEEGEEAECVEPGCGEETREEIA